MSATDVRVVGNAPFNGVTVGETIRDTCDFTGKAEVKVV